MDTYYRGRGDITWDAMQRAMGSEKRVELTEEQVRAVLDELPRTYASGRVSTRKLSETLSQWLPYTGARYGSDTRQAVTATLSEYMATVTRIPSIVERQRIALAFSQSLLTHGLIERDHLMLQLDMLNEAGAGRIVWEAEITPQNTIIVRARLNA